MGEGKSKMLRIEAPEGARRAVTTVGVDPRHPLAGGIEVNLDGELSLPRGEVGNILEKSGKIMLNDYLLVSPLVAADEYKHCYLRHCVWWYERRVPRWRVCCGILMRGSDFFFGVAASFRKFE